VKDASEREPNRCIVIDNADPAVIGEVRHVWQFVVPGPSGAARWIPIASFIGDRNYLVLDFGPIEGVGRPNNWPVLPLGQRIAGPSRKLGVRSLSTASRPHDDSASPPA
jgi:hypothetical protein